MATIVFLSEFTAVLLDRWIHSESNQRIQPIPKFRCLKFKIEIQ